MTDSDQTVRVAVGIIRSGDRVLVGIRESAAVLAGKHEFPGGKCKSGETPEACVIRECLEETGLAVEVVELFDCRRHTYDHGTVALHFYLCRLSTTADPEQSGRFRWIPVAQLAELNFPDANREVVARLLSGGES